MKRLGPIISAEKGRTRRLVVGPHLPWQRGEDGGATRGGSGVKRFSKNYLIWTLPPQLLYLEDEHRTLEYRRDLRY